MRRICLDDFLLFFLSLQSGRELMLDVGMESQQKPIYKREKPMNRQDGYSAKIVCVLVQPEREVPIGGELY